MNTFRCTRPPLLYTALLRQYLVIYKLVYLYTVGFDCLYCLKTDDRFITYNFIFVNMVSSYTIAIFDS